MLQQASPTAGDPRPKVRCRLIEPADIPAVVALLVESVAYRPASYWQHGFDRLSDRSLPEGVPRFGYVLDHDGALVGVLLTIYSAVPDDPDARLRCNLSSWYVKAAYRGLGTVMDSLAMRDRSVTYTNLSPAAPTIAMHEARGFRRYCGGQMLVVPALCRPGRGQAVRSLTWSGDPGIPDALRTLVQDHLGYGCLCLLCTEAGQARVVILQPMPLKVIRGVSWLPRLPVLQMVYAPPVAELARWLGAIGRHLLRRGRPFLLLDTDAPLKNVVGRHVAGWRPRYARGPETVPVNDLTYSEFVIFGP
ncbi:hypothetical protein Q8W71_21775 [Methylobacterium sp. NEAU 140]|uniref:GNAT family N-acetyltransferase n=1 Tax=Methylobacterium sp. NEAU 140 TaxID=3064945 RepID=UPI002734DA60|nr:hypothetical protein [Methylobacterium sp. NEAU 140]MDP4025263.1 hypothetical protein [Methylobacterium sp. NEAU 140]